MRLLFAEDDPMIGAGVRQGLAQEGFAVDWVRDGAAAEAALGENVHELVLLDLGLPRKDGLAVLAAMRRRGDARPVLVLTARDALADRVAGLDAGADDYLAKPFELAELAARLRALARRVHGADDVAEVGGLRFERNVGRFFVVGGAATSELELPAREHDVLVQLMTPPGRVVSKKVLADKLSGFDDHLGANALEAFVSRLRKKLVGSGSTIRTLRGLGYLIEPDRSPHG